MQGSSPTADDYARLRTALTGRYALERELGRGGMATVYLAQDLKHHRPVALKVVRPDLAAVLGPERFLREIAITAQLNHPHILPLLDSGEAAGFLFYAMPYAEGESLRERLTREKQLPVEDALQIARQVADALSYAHSRGVIHRDIKPENILLESGHAVVADFGIARAISVAGGEKLTATGVAVGTPEYMSPEQASGQSQLDGRSDIYALGCVLHEMLAGQPPFTGPTVESVVHQHLTVEAQPVTNLRPAVPGQVAGALTRALAKAPADRYMTAAQFAQALAPSQQGVPAGRRPPLIAAGIAAVLVVLGLGAYLALHRAKAPTAASATGIPRLAVLPFENLGAPEDEYFADGITDEILTKLAGLKEIAVIAPQSAAKYKGTDKGTAQIGKELSVQYLLEGRIQWRHAASGPSRVRVTPRLIRVADNQHLWANDYDEVLQDVFHVESDVATQVTSALGIALGGGEQRTVAQRPTQNLAAHELYLRGNAYFRAGFPTGPRLRDAVPLYQKAVQLDPGFAAAYARLSLAAGGIRWGNLDPGHAAEWLGKEETNAQQALALDSALPEAHVAMGFYRYWGRHDYQGALEQFDVALRAEPNNALFMESKAAIFKRTGDFAASAALNARASDLDPLAWSPPLEAWIGYSLIRDYDQAERYVERFVSLSPGHEWRVAYTRIWQHGNAFAVRESLTTTLGEAGTIRIAASAAHGENFPSQGHALVRMLCGDCVAAIPMVQSDRPQDWQRYEAIGLLYWQAGRARKARVYYDSARVRQEASRQSPAIADARLGRRQEAVSAAKQELWNGREAADRLSEIDGVQQLAQVYIMVGEYDAALDQLEWLMAHPSWLSVGLLKADPLYDPLRNNPRFQALIAKYDEPSRH